MSFIVNQKYHRYLISWISVFVVFLLQSSIHPNDKKTKHLFIYRGNPQLTGVVQGEFPDQPELLWTFQAKDEITTAAAIVENDVYFGSIDSTLYALDLNTGKLKWRYRATDAIMSSPSVYKNNIYFGDETGIFHAVNRKTGKSEWTFQTDSEIISSANFYQDRVIFGSYDQFLYCLSTEGKLIWKFETEQYIHATPAIYDGYVMISGCDGFFRIIDVETGKQKHSIYMGSQAAASAAILDDRAYIGTYGSQVLCIDLKKADIVWVYEHAKRHFPYYASAAVTKDIVLVAGRDKMLHALNSKTGESLWDFMTKSKIDSSPVIVGDRVIVAPLSGQIFALQIKTGEILWEYDTGSSIDASPSIANGKLIIGSLDGVLYCFGKKK